MSTELLGAKVDAIGRVIFSPEPAARRILFEAVYETPVGKEFLQYRNLTSVARVAEILEAKFLEKGRDILVDDCVNVIRDLIATKDPALFPADEPEPESVDARERNADGRFKSEFQIFSETHSSANCANRAKVDAEYRTWRQSQYRAEGLQEGAYRLAGTPTTEGTLQHRSSVPNDQVADFARVYKSVPSERLRARAGRITLDTEHSYTPQEYELLVGLASSAGLI